MDNDALKNMARAVLRTETDALLSLQDRIGEDFVRACEILLACRGRIVVTGMGKSGHIANKIAATLASTGSPAFFLHPAEASHGDLGMITVRDVVLAISNSGETGEIITLLPIIKRQGNPLVTLTGKHNSTIACAANVDLDVSVDREACPLGLAPTASTTAALAMGDALAISLLQARGFTEEDFARSHPGGTLGRRLLLRVEDLMHAGDKAPTVTLGTPLSEALLEMSRKGLGMTCVVDNDGRLQGIFTDGDLRRTLDRPLDIRNTPIDEVMTSNCRSIDGKLLAAEALNIMETGKINALVVVDESQRVRGALNMHDMLRAGVV